MALFLNPTIHSLATYLEAENHGKAGKEIPGSQPSDGEKAILNGSENLRVASNFRGQVA